MQNKSVTLKGRFLLSVAFIIAVNCLLFVFFLVSMERIRALKDVSYLSISTLSTWIDYRLASRESLLEKSAYRTAADRAKWKRVAFADKFRALSAAGRAVGIGGTPVELLDSLAGLWTHIADTLSRCDETFDRLETDGILRDLPPNSIAGSIADRSIPNASKLRIIAYTKQLNEADLPSAQFDRLLNELVAETDSGINVLIRNRTLIMLAIFVGINAVTFLLAFLFARWSERTEKEAERIKAQMLHMQKMESIGTLTGGIAHDFNNLLTVITGYSESLRDKMARDHPDYADLDAIYTTGLRAAELTRQLLTISSRQVVEADRHNLNWIIADMRSLLERIIGENIRMTTELCAGELVVLADKGQVEQIIINLAVNARDAMPNGGELMIRTDTISIDEQTTRTIPGSRKGDYCRIAFEDNGSGIAADIVGRIFDPFFTTKASGKGTGLGLSVVYGIVERHKGWINVYSQEGAGSVFKLYFPLAAEKTSHQPEETAAVATPRTGSRGGAERILLVEDDEQVRKFAAKVLRSHGYVVTEATGVKRAWEAIEKSILPFDLVFSDMVLEDGKGSSLAIRIHEQRPELLVLLTSGYSELNMKDVDDLRAGIQFLQKPYSSETLLQAVRAALREKRTP
jgi:signal transduction histidine kinase/ActR/RegA family two-component response regulator